MALESTDTNSKKQDTSATPEAMKPEVSVSGSDVRITLAGNIYERQPCDYLEEAISTNCTGGKTILIDCTKCSVISAYGIGKLLTCHKKVAAAQGTVILQSLSRDLSEIFQSLLLNRWFKIQ